MNPPCLLNALLTNHITTLAMKGERFYIRILGRKCTDGQSVSLYIRVKRDHEKGQILYSTGLKCPRRQFSPERQTITDNTIDTIIQGERLRVLRAIFALKEKGAAVTLADVRKALFKPVLTPTVGEVAGEVLKAHALVVTSRTHDSVRAALTTFISRLGWTDTPISSVTPAMLESGLMRVKMDFKPCTFSKYVSKLKSVFDHARRNELISVNPFERIDLKQIKKSKPAEKSEKPDRTSLETVIGEHAKSVPRLDDLAMFQLQTGMAFVDATTLTGEMFVEHDGQMMIVKERQKSGVAFTVPVSPETVELFRRNGGFEGVVYSSYRYYLQSRYNINSHDLRHARARDLLNKGLSLEAVAGVLGHTSTKMTVRYAPLSGRKLSREEVAKVLG